MSRMYSYLTCNYKMSPIAFLGYHVKIWCECFYEESQLILRIQVRDEESVRN
jgi:hypothetical protein